MVVKLIVIGFISCCANPRRPAALLTCFKPPLLMHLAGPSEDSPPDTRRAGAGESVVAMTQLNSTMDDLLKNMISRFLQRGGGRLV